MAVDTQPSILTELADFLVSQPTLEEIASYSVSPAVQAHLEALLEKNRETVLSPDERFELEKLLAVSHLMTLMKAKAQLKLANK